LKFEVNLPCYRGCAYIWAAAKAGWCSDTDLGDNLSHFKHQKPISAFKPDNAWPDNAWPDNAWPDNAWPDNAWILAKQNTGIFKHRYSISKHKNSRQFVIFH